MIYGPKYEIEWGTNVIRNTIHKGMIPLPLCLTVFLQFITGSKVLRLTVYTESLNLDSLSFIDEKT